jgi:hypothetical protein
VLCWRTLNRIRYSSRIWIRMSILISYHRTCLNMNAVLWTNSWIGYRTTLTTLEFWVWHALVVILVRILLNILEIYWISIRLRLTSCWSWTLHYQICLMVGILWSIWWDATQLHSHSWVVLVENLLSDNNLICSSYTRIFGLLFRIIRWMKWMNWTSTLSWKLRSHLWRPKAIILATLLLSEVLFDL